ETPRDYEIYNLGGNRPVELMYFISLIEKELGIEAKKEFLPIQPGDVPETYADIEKARRDLGYEPRTPIEKGVKRFTEWFREYHQDLFGMG
ncbi:protein CapI, partial [Thermoplasmatales archaeon ex4484_36]